MHKHSLPESLKALEDQNIDHWTKIENDGTWEPNQATLYKTWMYKNGTRIRIVCFINNWEFRSNIGELLATIPRTGDDAFQDLEKIYSPTRRKSFKRAMDKLHLFVLKNAPSNTTMAQFCRFREILILFSGLDFEKQDVPKEFKSLMQKHKHILQPNPFIDEWTD